MSEISQNIIHLFKLKYFDIGIYVVLIDKYEVLHEIGLFFAFNTWK